MKIYEKLILLGMVIQVIGEGIQAYYNLKGLLGGRVNGRD
ncbi:hypothetical protein HMPREF9956_0309 [Staphylococcus epidermidis 14.1.R1.SE]|nr:hypothetical protein HMPREF9956_0309 [Staphylococcus epidermidis 14.1.R1.SE]